MRQRKETISIVWANILSIGIFVVISIVFSVVYIRIWGEMGFWQDLADHPLSMLWFLLLFFLGVVVHELVHGITWACFAPSGFRSISFGVMWKMLTPYCHCSEPLLRNHYIIGAAMPLIVLGLLPVAIALMIGSPALLWYGIVLVTAASGDIMVIVKTLKERPDCLLMDHPTEAGYYVFENEEGQE